MADWGRSSKIDIAILPRASLGLHADSRDDGQASELPAPGLGGTGRGQDQRPLGARGGFSFLALLKK